MIFIIHNSKKCRMLIFIIKWNNLLYLAYSIINIMMKYLMPSGGRFNIKMSSYQYRKSHCGDKTILRPSYLHNGISYTGKMTSLYWIGALIFIANVKQAGSCLCGIFYSLIGVSIQKCYEFQMHNYTLHSTKLKGVHWFHLVRLFVCPSVCLWTESCPLCIFHKTSQIHFICTYLINQFQMVCCVLSFVKIPNFEFLAISLNFSLWLCLLSM